MLIKSQLFKFSFSIAIYGSKSRLGELNIYRINPKGLGDSFQPISQFFHNYKIPPSGIEPEYPASEADALSVTPRGPDIVSSSLAIY